MKKKSLPKILFGSIIIIIIVYIFLIKPNYYRLNGGKIYFETMYTNSFSSKDKVDFYVHNKYIYMSSADGLKKQTINGDTIWSKTFNMEEPLLLAKENYMGVVNITGKEVVIFNKDGFLTEFKVNYPIITADINENGFIAIVQENEQQHLIELYNQKGNLLAERVTRFKQDGYPIDVEISSNALKMVTSYIYLGENSLQSRISFFDFSDQNEIEKIVGGFTLEGTFAPEIEFLTKSKVLVAGDNLLNYYSIGTTPNAIKEIPLKNEIKNVTFTDKYVILQENPLNNKESNIQYITIYNNNGNKVGKFKIGQEIKNIVGSDKYYYVITTAYIRQYKGSKKIWENTIKKEIKDIKKLDDNKYLLIYQQGYDVVKVKSI